MKEDQRPALKIDVREIPRMSTKLSEKIPSTPMPYRVNDAVADLRTGVAKLHGVITETAEALEPVLLPDGPMEGATGFSAPTCTLSQDLAQIVHHVEDAIRRMASLKERIAL